MNPCVQAVLRSMLAKQHRELVRKSRVSPSLTRNKRRLAVDKLDDANLAGTKHGSKECTLILTEGPHAFG